MFESTLLTIDHAIAFCGVAIIAYSAAKAAYLFLLGITGTSMDVNRIRLELGHGIILGLEFIVAADIIESIAKPNYYDIGMLAILVVIRTFLNYFLNKELQDLSPEKKETIQNLSK